MDKLKHTFPKLQDEVPGCSTMVNINESDDLMGAAQEERIPKARGSFRRKLIRRHSHIGGSLRNPPRPKLSRDQTRRGVSVGSFPKDGSQEDQTNIKKNYANFSKKIDVHSQVKYIL